jgi:hypothetical protein
MLRSWSRNDHNAAGFVGRDVLVIRALNPSTIR